MVNDKVKYYVMINNGKYFYNTDIKCALIKISNNNYCICHNPDLKADEKGTYFTDWSYGSYFSSYKSAINKIISYLNEIISDKYEEIYDIKEDIELLEKLK